MRRLANIRGGATTPEQSQGHGRTGQPRRWPESRLFVGGALLAAICICSVSAPLLTSADPVSQVLEHRLRPPMWDAAGSFQNPLGTDTFGRDVLSRLLYGGRYSLAVAIAAVLVSGMLGVLLAAIAGYYGGWPGLIIMRAVDAQQALPTVLFAIIVAALFGSSFLNLVLVLAITGWDTYARILYGVIRGLRARDFVLASISVGAGSWRVITRHVLPNAFTPIIVIATLQVGRVILLEAGLSYLGLGVPEPLPAWGLMLAEGQRSIFSAPWLTTIPGLAITVTVFSINLLGDGLRRALDPHTTGAR